MSVVQEIVNKIIHWFTKPHLYISGGKKKKKKKKK